MTFYRLDSDRDTLLLQSKCDAVPEIGYFGPRLEDDVNLDSIALLTERALPQGVLDVEEPASWLPEAGRGFFGWPGLSAHRDGGDTSTQFLIDQTLGGKCSWSFVCEDVLAGLGLTIDISLDPQTSVLSARTQLHNNADDALTLDWLAAASLDIPPRCSEVLSIGGRWGKEFQGSRTELGDGLFLRESRVGRGSHHCFAGIAMCEPGCSDEHGDVLALHLGWSGNHRLLAERLRDGRIQTQLGELLAPGEIIIEPGATYHSPTAYVARSGSGFNGIRRRYHAHLRQHVIPPNVAARPRPVHFNTWDALRFDHDLEALHELVGLAADVGVERFVVDDGWFKGRHDDNAALGDWTPCVNKYPQGLKPLADVIREHGMEFGLWVEPEMTNRDSDLFREHPDWVLGDSRREQPLGRNQYALDMTRAEIRDHLFNRLVALVEDNDIDYLKWDMNRDLVHAISCGSAASRRQTLGVYELIDRLRTRFPALEIEACSSGGARVDYEMCKRADRVWVSDCHDPCERQHMQHMFSLFFVPEIMGTHVGPRTCPVTRRSHSTFFKAATALFGSFGIEADLRDFSADERAQLAQFTAMYRKHRVWMHKGQLGYLDTSRDDLVACCNIAADRRRALVSAATVKVPRYATLPALRVPNLDPQIDYSVRIIAPHNGSFAKRQPPLFTGDTLEASASLLANIGISLPVLPPENAVLIEILPATSA